MDIDTPLFHGTAAPGIQQFETGIAQYGEMDEPINAIWLCTRFEGAKWHAVGVAGRIRNTANTYVYECRLSSETVVEDTKKAQLRPDIFKRFLKCYMPWYIQLAYKLPSSLRVRLIANHMWFRLVLEAAKKMGNDGTYNGTHNSVIAICRKIGIDVLVNPSTILRGDQLAHYDENVYGSTALLINCKKAVPILQYQF